MNTKEILSLSEIPETYIKYIREQLCRSRIECITDPIIVKLMKEYNSTLKTLLSEKSFNVSYDPLNEIIIKIFNEVVSKQEMYFSRMIAMSRTDPQRYIKGKGPIYTDIKRNLQILYKDEEKEKTIHKKYEILFLKLNFIDPLYITYIRSKLIKAGKAYDICVSMEEYNTLLNRFLTYYGNTKKKSNNTILRNTYNEIISIKSLFATYINQEYLYTELTNIISILFDKSITNDDIDNYEYRYYEKIPDDFFTDLDKAIYGINTQVNTIHLGFKKFFSQFNRSNTWHLNILYEYSIKYNLFIDTIKEKYKLYEAFLKDYNTKFPLNYNNGFSKYNKNYRQATINVRKNISYIFLYLELFKLHIQKFKIIYKKFYNEKKSKEIIDKLKSYIDQNEIKHIYINFIKNFIKILNGSSYDNV